MSDESQKVQISIRGIIEDLANGVTRCVGDNGYNEEIGSIQEKYGLNKSQISRMFKHPQLKGKRVHVTVEDPFELIDDVGDEVISSSTYGERSAASVARAQENPVTTEETFSEEEDGKDSTVDHPVDDFSLEV